MDKWGFFVKMSPKKFLNLLKNDKSYLERQPLEKRKKNKLGAYKHFGFCSAWIL